MQAGGQDFQYCCQARGENVGASAEYLETSLSGELHLMAYPVSSPLLSSRCRLHEDPPRTGGRRATNQGTCTCGTGHWDCKHDEEENLSKETEGQTFVPAPQEHRGLQNFTRVEGG